MEATRAVGIRAVGFCAAGIRAVGFCAVGIRAVGFCAVGNRAVGFCAEGNRAVGFCTVGLAPTVKQRIQIDHLRGPVVNAPVFGAGGRGFKSQLVHTCQLKIGIHVATMHDAWCDRVDAMTGWPSVSIL